jgi:hypothetical protein
VMDMLFRDDECRIRTEHAPANFTTLGHMAQNLYRKSPVKDSMCLDGLRRLTTGRAGVSKTQSCLQIALGSGRQPVLFCA